MLVRHSLNPRSPHPRRCTPADRRNCNPPSSDSAPTPPLAVRVRADLPGVMNQPVQPMRSRSAACSIKERNHASSTRPRCTGRPVHGRARHGQCGANHVCLRWTGQPGAASGSSRPVRRHYSQGVKPARHRRCPSRRRSRCSEVRWGRPHRSGSRHGGQRYSGRRTRVSGDDQLARKLPAEWESHTRSRRS